MWNFGAVIIHHEEPLSTALVPNAAAADKILLVANTIVSIVPEKQPCPAATTVSTSRQPWNALETVSHKGYGRAGEEEPGNAQYRAPEPPEEVHSRDDKPSQENDG